MDLTTAEAIALQTLVELAHGGLAIGEDDRGLDVVVFQQPAQRVALLAGLYGHLERGDVLVRGRRAADFDPLRIVEKLLGELLDRWRHGRREQHCLPRFGKLGADEFDIGDEPHVEHAIGFVDDQQFAAVEQDLAPFEKIHKPARRGDQHVDAIVQRLDLIAHLHAANQQRELEIVVLAVFLEVFGHLGCEFARRRENQRTRHQCAPPSAGHDVDHRQHEAGSLARARLRDPDDVLHHQDRRNRFALDVGRLCIAGFAYCFEQVFGKAEIGESHAVRNCPWNTGLQVAARPQHWLGAPFAGIGPKVKKSRQTRRECQSATAINRWKSAIRHFAPARDINRSRLTQSCPSGLRST